METKLTQINTILDLPIKSSLGNQGSSSIAGNSATTSFAVGKKQNSTRDDSYIKEKSGGFENALKEKININDSENCKDNESDESEESKDQNDEASLSSDQAANVLVPDIVVEQIVAQDAIGDTAELVHDDIQVFAQPQDITVEGTASSYNNTAYGSQVAADMQTLPPQIEQGVSVIEDQQATVISDANQSDLSQVELDNTQVLKNDQLSNKNETPSNKPSDSAGQTDTQPTEKNIEAKDILTSTSQSNPTLLNENQQSQQQSQTIASDSLKKAENLSPLETISNNELKRDQIRPLKNVQENTFQNDTNQFAGTQLSEGATEASMVSDNNAAEVKSTDVFDIDVANKVDNVHQHVTTHTNIPTNTHQSELNKDVSQAQNIENLAQSVAKQVQNSVNTAINSNQNQITVNLNPPELGRISIKLIENENQISGVLQVTKNQTRTEIENALPQIIRNLEQSGIQVKRIDVEVYDQNNMNHQGSKDHGFQNNFTAQQDSQHQHGNSNNSANTGLENEKSYLAEKNTGNYQLDSALDSESINLFA